MAATTLTGGFDVPQLHQVLLQSSRNFLLFTDSLVYKTGYCSLHEGKTSLLRLDVILVHSEAALSAWHGVTLLPICQLAALG